MQHNFYTILIDTQKYLVSESSIKKSTLLWDTITRKVYDSKIDYDTEAKTLFIDNDPTSFKYILDTLRGYEFNPKTISDPNLLNKITQDMKYYKVITGTLDIKNEMAQIADLDVSINDISDIIGPEPTNNAPMLDTFKDMIFKKPLAGGNNSDINLGDSLQTDDVNQVNTLFQSINQKLQSDNPFDAINSFSNNENVKRLVMQSNSMKDQDSDTDSMEFDMEPDTSELKTEVSNIVTPTKPRSSARFVQI
jgi:hypothetical protein